MADLDYLNIPLERSYPTPLSNSSLLPMLLLSLARQEKHTPDTLHNASQVKREYDYVIVGSGAAGSVVAARLSEMCCIDVLLLEAGPKPPRMSEIPGVGGAMWHSNITWQFMSTPQKHTGSALVNRQIPFLGGKVVGGSTVVNAGLYIRGNKKDYNDWAKNGAPGWSYDDVLPYFKKSENNTDPEFVKNGYHGTKGPATISKPDYHPEVKDPIMEAAKSLGYEFIDPNGPTQTGFYDLQAYLRDNRRCSTAKAYLVPAENRTNLDILPNALVRKVKINKVTKRATGVVYEYDGKTYEVGARREVIMSAGAINTPRLLMLSGIGPKKQLKKFNIPVKADLPVGKNLQDQAGYPIFIVLNSSIPEFSKKLANEDNIQQYIDRRSGPLASPTGVNILALLQSKGTEPKDFPNYSIFFLEEINMSLAASMNFEPEVFQNIFGEYFGKPIMLCYTHYLHCMSRGTVKLRSTDPRDTPLIDPNYLADPADEDAIVDGMKTCLSIANSSHMSKVISHVLETPTPGCNKTGDEDKYLRCLARSGLATIFHFCGTAKMGKRSDPTTVVDHELKVKGILGLRVIDASIIPQIPAAHLSTTSIMIGEKGSDMIKQTIKCPKKCGNFSEDFRIF